MCLVSCCAEPRILLKPLRCVLTNCFQHQEARLSGILIRLSNQALIDKRIQPIENVDFHFIEMIDPGRYGLRCLECATRKH